MKKTTTLLLSLAFLAAPVAAQHGGSINRDAPTVVSGIEFKNSAKLHVKYLAINFGEGAWQSILKRTARHEGFNAMAARKPLGQIHTNVAVTASGREIPAGKYDMFFTVHEQAGWLLNLKNKANADAKVIRWRMAMTDLKTSSKRFKVQVQPGEETNSANITIAFGAKSVTVPLKVGTPGAKKKKVQ